MAEPFLDTQTLIVDPLERIMTAWQRNKGMTVALTKACRELGGSFRDIAERTQHCADRLNIAAFKGPDGEVLFRVNVKDACNYRLDPVCARMRSRRMIARTRPKLDQIFAPGGGLTAGFLTLTAISVPLADIRTGTAGILQGWRRMTQRKPFKQAIAGFARAEEVTLHDTRPLAHPHLHVLLAFRAGYHRRTAGLYIPREQWLAMWQGSMKNRAIRMVDIRSLRPRNPEQPLASACAELLKYPFKPTIFEVDGPGYRVDPKKIEVLHNGLHRRRLFGTGGILRGAKLEAEERENLCDEDGVLTIDDIEDMIRDAREAPLAVENYRWHADHYVGGAT